jgi:hypothetical protein
VRKTFLFPEEIASRMLGFKLSLSTIILTFVLFTGGMQFESADVVYGQFFEEPETNSTSSSNSTSNSTSSENPNAADIVLLSQKLKKSSFGYRDLVGQVKNIGSDSAAYVEILLTVYDKKGGVIGTEGTYADVDLLKPGQKSTFKFFTSADDFKGMDHYELSIEWQNHKDSSQGYLENAKIYKPNTTKYTETPDDTDTNTNTGTHNSGEFPQTREYCNTVKTQLGKELCDKLLS